MKYCVHCGQELNDNAVYCTKCGKPVEEKKEEPVAAPVVAKKTPSGLGFAVASICCFWFPILGFVFGGVGLYQGIKARKTSSIVCSAIGIFMTLVFVVAAIIAGIIIIPQLIQEYCYENGTGGYFCHYAAHIV